MTIKVEQDRQNCIGCGACAAICPDYWSMADDGKARIKGAKPEGANEVATVPDSDKECNMSAAQSCPVNVIRVIENGKKLI